MRITFIGESSCIPDVGHEMSCFIVDGRHLFDTGWCAALRMREFGFNPLDLDSIIISHFHQDHYLGLPHLLFYIGLRRPREAHGTPLTVAGPADNLERILSAIDSLLQLERFPELKVDYEPRALNAGDAWESEDLRFECFAVRHTSGHGAPEQALGYRVSDRQDGHWLAFTGDTHHHPPIADEVRGAPLLIHDGAHTPPADAAAIAANAEVERLVLTHYGQERAQQVLNEAQKVFPNTSLAQPGMSIDLSADGVLFH